MKNWLIPSLLLSFGACALAETTVTLSGVHNCCKGCANGITKAAAGIKDTTVAVDGTTVTITARSKKNAKEAAEAILEAGYFGTASDESLAAKPAASDRKLTGTTTVSGVHLCCGKCVKAVSEAVATVSGVTSSKIEQKQTSFTVEGEFTEAALTAALNKAGFAGKIGK